MDDDPFSDVRAERGALGGILSGDALKDLHDVKTPFDKAGKGIAVRYTCQTCGLPHDIYSDWEDLLRIMLGTAPSGWFIDTEHGIVRPHFFCGRCGQLFAVGLTPQECSKYIDSGIQAGYLTRQSVQQAVQMIQAQPAPQR